MCEVSLNDITNICSCLANVVLAGTAIYSIRTWKEQSNKRIFLDIARKIALELTILNDKIEALRSPLVLLPKTKDKLEEYKAHLEILQNNLNSVQDSRMKVYAQVCEIEIFGHKEIKDAYTKVNSSISMLIVMLQDYAFSIHPDNESKRIKLQQKGYFGNKNWKFQGLKSDDFGKEIHGNIDKFIEILRSHIVM